MTAYESLRQRHVQDAMAKVGELIDRLDWPAERLAEHRRAGLRRLLRTARAASPWHRKRLGDIDADAVDEHRLADLPVMTKDDLMANFDEIVTDDRLRLDVVDAHLDGLDQDAYLFDRYHAIASGGSSGRRGVFVYDWDAWALAYFGITRRLMRDLMPVSAGMPAPPLFAFVGAGNATHITYAATQTFSTPKLATRRFPITAPVARIVAGLNDCRPTVLAGYASGLYLLAHEAQAGRLRIAPRFVLSSGEPLLPEIRAAAEQAWGMHPRNVYACSETGPLAIACGQGQGAHLADDLVIVEPVDEGGHPVPPGQRAAKIYVTNLFNHTLPLIRYEITDEVTVLDAVCPCGSAQPLIADPQGRLDDVFIYSDLVVHPHVFRSPLGRDHNVVEYQVRQTRQGADVLVRCQGPVDLPALQTELTAKLAALGLRAPQVSVKPTDRIERGQSTGKLRRFVPYSPTNSGS